MLATEISAAKRERDFYMSRVAKAKATAAQKERKLKVCPSKHPVHDSAHSSVAGADHQPEHMKG